MAGIMGPRVMPPRDLMGAVTGTMAVLCGTGPIPKELGGLYLLEGLHLGNNKLSGEL